MTVCRYCGEADMELVTLCVGNPSSAVLKCPKCGATVSETTRQIHGPVSSYPPREPFRLKILTQQDWRPGPGR